MSGDRDYFYLVTTLDTGDRSRAEVIDSLAETVRPAWRELVDAGVLYAGRALWRASDLELPDIPLDWTLILVGEVAEGVDPGAAAAAEEAALSRHGFVRDGDVRVLGVDVCRRACDQNTPVPRPSPVHAAPPAGWRPAVVHVDFERDQIHLGEAAMREFHGPLSCALVESGDAYRMIITDVVTTRTRHASSPAWNHLSILEGDWDGRFKDATTRIVGEMAAADPTLMQRVAEADQFQRTRQGSIVEELDELAVATASSAGPSPAP